MRGALSNAYKLPVRCTSPSFLRYRELSKAGEVYFGTSSDLVQAMSKTYDHVNWDLIDDSTLRTFSSHNVWRWLVAVGLEWLLIAAVIAVCLMYPRWWVWILGAFLIGTRQHGLAVLAHDGAHHLLARSPFWDDTLTNCSTSFLLAFPL